MPHHRRGVEDVSLAADKFTGILKSSGDLARLHDPPLRRPRMNMTKHRVWIERSRVRAPASTSTAGRRRRTPSGVLRIVRISVAVNRIGEQVILQRSVIPGAA